MKKRPALDLFCYSENCTLGGEQTIVPQIQDHDHKNFYLKSMQIFNLIMEWLGEDEMSISVKTKLI